MKRLIVCLFFCMHLCAAQAGLMLQVDNNQVQFGETFRIMLTLDGAQQDSVPDLTALEANFDIIGTERSSNYSVVNGKAQSNSRWIITLMARQPGKVIIPPIQVGTEATQETAIDVITSQIQNQTPTDKQAEVMLTATVSTDKPYVNQQVIYTVKLYNSRRLLDAEYQAPQVEDALLVPLGSGQSSQVAANGQIYAVEQQQYAIFPQKSGALKIKPPAFNALVYDVSPRKIHVQAEETTLDVQAVPAKLSMKNWLPAKQVRITEKYDRQSSSMLQGNTLIRTVTMEVTGSPAQLLPALQFIGNDQFSVYPENPIAKNTVRNNDLVGSSTIKLTYLLNKPGKIVIPELEIPWFNTVTGKQEVSTLPSLTINVAAVNNNNSTSSNHLSAPQAPVQNPLESKPDRQIIDKADGSSSFSMAWWIAATLLFLWLLTLLLWWRNPVNRVGKKQLLAQLQKACQSNDAVAAQTALVQWANWQWSQETILTLADINQLTTDMVLKKAINELARVLYSPASQAWDGEKLWQAVVNHQIVSHEKTRSAKVLPELYP